MTFSHKKNQKTLFCFDFVMKITKKNGWHINWDDQSVKF